VTIIFQNVGNAPVLQPNLRKLTANETDPFLKVITYLRSPKLLNLDSTDAPLFLYLKQAFSPQPTEKVGTLADAFGYLDNGNKHLVVHYSITQAWG